MSSKVRVRRWKLEDLPALLECQKLAYEDYLAEDLCDERILNMQFTAFPEGQYLAESKGRVVGYATSIIVQLDDDKQTYTYSELTGGATYNTHTPSGDTLYGADIAVIPEFRGMGIAGQLYMQRKKLLKRYNLRRMVAYGRIPGYEEVAGKMTAEEYVKEVEQGKRLDSSLNAHLKAGYRVKHVMLNIMQDKSSMNYSTWIEMLNPDYNAAKRKIAAAPLQRPNRKIRVCAAQYLMRKISKWEEFVQTVEFFVDTAESYHSHFLLFPELFTANLFSTMPPDWDDKTAIQALAKMADQYIDLLKEKARSHNLHIIGGSHPILRDGLLYNVAHLFTPNGNVYTQDKLHITPGERLHWGIQPGEGINVFETEMGRIGIQICYDIEFPEITRLMTFAGVETMFVPFSTDEKKSYYRVRYTAQARAVENSIYVVIAGNVGNLPSVKSYLLNYGQAAIFTPSDFAFPLRAIAGEAEPEAETVVISDLDLTTLEQQREIGSVRPLYDRRPDLYDLSAKIPVKIIQTD